MGEGGEPTSPYIHYEFDKERYTKKNFGGGPQSFIGRVKLSYHKIGKNLPWTHKKLHCKEEP